VAVLHIRQGQPPGSVYIGRPSKWGNPFEVGKDGTREEVLLKYTAYFLGRPDLIEAARTELRGWDLVCFCKPLACHGDLLHAIANGGPP